MVALECNKSWLWEQSLPINFGRMSHFFLFIPCQSLKTNFCWENGLLFSPRHLALISNPLPLSRSRLQASFIMKPTVISSVSASFLLHFSSFLFQSLFEF